MSDQVKASLLDPQGLVHLDTGTMHAPIASFDIAGEKWHILADHESIFVTRPNRIDAEIYTRLPQHETVPDIVHVYMLDLRRHPMTPAQLADVAMGELIKREKPPEVPAKTPAKKSAKKPAEENAPENPPIAPDASKSAETGSTDIDAGKQSPSVGNDAGSGSTGEVDPNGDTSGDDISLDQEDKEHIEAAADAHSALAHKESVAG